LIFKTDHPAFMLPAHNSLLVASRPGAKMNKELYVSTTPHETKVALVEDDLLAEVYFERENEYTLAGSIYKGRVTRVLPGMQSAFVDIGLERDAFLYVSDFLELEDEEEDAEFGEVKVTGSTLAQANGLIIVEPEPVEQEEDAAEEPQENTLAETEAAQGEGKDAGAPRWRGRRRRRGRRGGRDRMPGDRTTEAQPGAIDSEAPAGDQESADDSDETATAREPEAAAPREPRKRELRGFEPRGLVVHGLARTVDEPEEIAPELEAEPEPEPEVAPIEPKPSAPAVATYTPMLLPGESISKYNRADGEVPASAPAAESGPSEEPERSYGRGRGGDRDRGGRGRRGDRDRGRDRVREPREPRERESFALPENYTPIVLPGESISKYRGVEPVTAPEPVQAAAPIEPVAGPQAAAPLEYIETAFEGESVAPSQPETNPDEPLSSASYSGVSSLPSLTQRRDADTEVFEEEAETTKPSELTQEAMQEPMLGETAAAVPTVFTTGETTLPEPSTAEARTEMAEPEEPVAAPTEAAQIGEGQTETSTAEAVSGEGEASVSDDDEAKNEDRSPAPLSWRDRISKIFGAVQEDPAASTESKEQESAKAEVEEQGAAPERKVAAEGKTASFESQFGSFVIEGGNVEHEELDEEETEMPALAEHFDRYEESETDEDVIEDGNGSQFGTAVRETEEESELEDEEYDFGADEFEESELLADEASDEDDTEEPRETEEPEVAVAPEPGHQRPERYERPGRRGRRGAPPPRGGGRMRARQQTRALPLISELLKEGQEILVQIAKEPIGKKGARITSHIALPGRFLVYMPTVNHIGVSRKISSEDERLRLKRIVSSERENGHGGFIVRTAAANIKEDELRADIRFLKHLWTEIRTRAESSKSPSLIYHDLNLVERILRDQVTSDFSQIWVDNEGEYERVVRFASRFQPNLVRRIKLYTKDTPLYEQFGINEEINKSLKSKVWLKSGGYIVINQTEALVAIDINTGKYVGKTSRLEDTIVKTNCDAVKEIVRQIRLRDLGGIIVVDFIDMDERKNRQKVMQALEEAMKSDRAPSKILQFNDFGLVAITRKRVKQSLERTLGTPCPYCDATGFVKSVQTVCNEIYVEMRKVRRHVESKEIILRVNPEVAKELKAGNGKWLQEMEELLGHSVLVKSDSLLHQEQFDMNY
jgi:Rne/Rng family ribonuclease